MSVFSLVTIMGGKRHSIRIYLQILLSLYSWQSVEPSTSYIQQEIQGFLEKVELYCKNKKS